MANPISVNSAQIFNQQPTQVDDQRQQPQRNEQAAKGSKNTSTGNAPVSAPAVTKGKIVSNTQSAAPKAAATSNEETQGQQAAASKQKPNTYSIDVKA